MSPASEKLIDAVMGPDQGKDDFTMKVIALEGITWINEAR